MSEEREYRRALKTLTAALERSEKQIAGMREELRKAEDAHAGLRRMYLGFVCGLIEEQDDTPE